MGSFALVQNKSQPIMKVLLLVALAIATIMAEPEADAAAHAPDDKVALHPGSENMLPSLPTLSLETQDIPWPKAMCPTMVTTWVKGMPKLLLMLMDIMVDFTDTHQDMDMEMVTMDTATVIGAKEQFFSSYFLQGITYLSSVLI